MGEGWKRAIAAAKATRDPKKPTPTELPDCAGCTDPRSEGTHGYGTKQHGLAPAESSELSRSQQKRIAAMKGERPPTFGVEPSVPAFTPRLLMVYDGVSWFVRQVRAIEHDLDRDEKIYRCDMPAGGPFKSLDDAVAGVRAALQKASGSK